MTKPDKKLMKILRKSDEDTKRRKIYTTDKVRKRLGLLTTKSSTRRKTALNRAVGMWRGRDDLPDYRAIRAEWDRH